VSDVFRPETPAVIASPLTIASAAAGNMTLFGASLSPPTDPFRPWGDHIPGVMIFAYIAAIWLIAGGAAILRPRRSRGYYWLMLGYAAPPGKVE